MSLVINNIFASLYPIPCARVSGLGSVQSLARILDNGNFRENQLDYSRSTMTNDFIFLDLVSKHEIAKRNNHSHLYFKHEIEGKNLPLSSLKLKFLNERRFIIFRKYYSFFLESISQVTSNESHSQEFLLELY